jgi:hypothetical protein
MSMYRWRVFFRRLTHRVKRIILLILLATAAFAVWRSIQLLEPDFDTLLTPEQKQLVADRLEVIRKDSPSDDLFRRCEPDLRKALMSQISGKLTTAAEWVDSNLQRAGCIDIYSHIVFAPENKPNDPVFVSQYGDILYIRIRTFMPPIGQNAHRLDDFPLKQVILQNKNGTVYLDMRGNLGGNVEEMHRVLEYFAPRGGIPYGHVRAERSTVSTAMFTSVGTGPLARFSIVIFVDRQCASACEWLSRILRYEWYPDKTKVVGEPTVGKGVVQCSVGETMHLTCETIEINGKPYHGMPIQPDVKANLSGCSDKDLLCLLPFAKRS